MNFKMQTKSRVNHSQAKFTIHLEFPSDVKRMDFI